jgi:pimeloyl-ACP methyl ester carboxylesterase
VAASRDALGRSNGDAPIATAFPDGFRAPQDRALGAPVLGFGAAGPVARVPVVLVHGNNDTPYPTSCNADYGKMTALAAFLHERGWARSELWGLGWQGDQCDLSTNPPARSGAAHTVDANVTETGEFVREVLRFTGAGRVDVVAHSLGAPLVRELLRRDGAWALVRRFVSIDGSNHGIISCSPSVLNFYALPPLGGFSPNAPVCRELGSVRTPLLAALNAGDETPGPTTWTTIDNADTSFVYFSKQDGIFPPVPAQDRDGWPHDFSASARLDGAAYHGLTGQARYQGPTGSAHTGILASPETHAIIASVLGAPEAVAAARVSVATSRRGRVLGIRGGGTLCSGTVSLRVRARGFTTTRRAALRGCRYRAKVRLPRGTRHVSVTARLGDAVTTTRR